MTAIHMGTRLGRLLLTVVLLLASVVPARANDAERLAMGQLRLSTDAGVARECAHMGAAKDDSLKDLRRKIVKAGGNTAVLSFRAEDLSRIHAEIFRCASGPPPAFHTPPPPPVVGPSPVGPPGPLGAPGGAPPPPPPPPPPSR